MSEAIPGGSVVDGSTGVTGNADVVQVWLVRDDLSGSELALADLYAVLDAEERQRADAFIRAGERRRFIVAHGAIRLIVGDQLGAPARDLHWKRGPHGKPELTGMWTGLQANLSHSGGLSLVAVTASRRVGADIQQLVPGLDVAAMAKRYFPPDETRFVIAAHDADGRADRFAQLWARKEALVKAGGGRLTPGLAVPVQGRSGVVAHYPDKASPGLYRITDIPAPPGFRAAVALSGDADYQVVAQEWDWQVTAD
jgi:4'-phosphopantetheinyl transferase